MAARAIVGLRSAWQSGALRGAARVHPISGPMMARSISTGFMSQLQEQHNRDPKGLQGLWYRMKLYIGMEKTPVRIREPFFKNIHGRPEVKVYWRTTYNMGLTQYTRYIRKKSTIRRLRKRRYKYLRRKLRRDVKAYLKQKLDSAVARKKAAKGHIMREIEPDDEDEFAPREADVMTKEVVHKKWLPVGYFKMPRVEGNHLQPLAPEDYDPTAPPIMKRKPRTPSLRHAALIDRSALYKGRSLRALTVPQRKTGGRNNTGHTTTRHRGGGYRHHYRLVDFKRLRHLDMAGIIERIEYDPNRSAFICLVKHHVPEGKYMPLAETAQPYSYIICPRGVRIGDQVMASRAQELEDKPGNCMMLKYMRPKTEIHNIELHPKRGAQVVRSAGTKAVIVEKDEERNLALVKMPSTELRYFKLDCMATIGTVSNPNHSAQILGKAGRRRNKGWRPSVRGVAMNPSDHPHGGGNGKTGTGGPPKSPWGWLTLGGRKTRPKSKQNFLIYKNRHQVKRERM